MFLCWTMIVALFFILLPLNALTSGQTSGQSLDQTLDAADQQLDALTSRVVSLTDQLDGILKEMEEDKFTFGRLDKRMNRWEDRTGACRVGFFPCSAAPEGYVQCVRDYLVCDGSADCKNGADENKDRCQHPFEKEVTMPMIAQVSICFPVKTGPANIHEWTIDPATVMPWFPAKPKLTWLYKYPMANIKGEGTGTVPTEGVYDYATGDIVFEVGHIQCRAFQEVFTSQKSLFMHDCYRINLPGSAACRQHFVGLLHKA